MGGAQAPKTLCVLVQCYRVPRSSSNVGEFYRSLLLDAAFSGPYYNLEGHEQSAPICSPTLAQESGYVNAMSD